MHSILISDEDLKLVLLRNDDILSLGCRAFPNLRITRRLRESPNRIDITGISIDDLKDSSKLYDLASVLCDLIDKVSVKGITCNFEPWVEPYIDIMFELYECKKKLSGIDKPGKKSKRHSFNIMCPNCGEPTKCSDNVISTCRSCKSDLIRKYGTIILLPKLDDSYDGNSHKGYFNDKQHANNQTSYIEVLLKIYQYIGFCLLILLGGGLLGDGFVFCSNGHPITSFGIHLVFKYPFRSLIIFVTLGLVVFCVYLLYRFYLFLARSLVKWQVQRFINLYRSQRLKLSRTNPTI